VKNLKEKVLNNWIMVSDDFKIRNRWAKFQKCFDRQWATLWFEEQFYKNYELTMEGLLEDNIQYVEANVPLGAIYNFEKKFSDVECADIFLQLSKKYANENPKDFFGIHLIHETTRAFDSKYVYEHMKSSIALQKQFGSFICGYDLVGHEDGPLSHDALYFMESKLKIKEEASKEGIDFKFYLHGGESLDPIENLFDLILLGTKRIGHGYNLFRFPKLYELMKEKEICVEVCPISNHVLGYIDDLRNHPAIGYLANNIPVVVSPDDPGMMSYSGVTHDYFASMVYWNLDLSGVKQLILNSIRYSSLDQKGQQALLEMWQVKYDTFIDQILQEYNQ
jgi:adenosine deaminase CECR1